ncbi:hypothetical protein [Streptomyces capillispiralis]|uniref:Uncharacterized protein n=1 Tax=Streptomyces capillispiralis TaxID=68182 RepID=A0A561TID0_9ACTN|nr:hypothetical protein [Streptomyces capillispiralis]TWF86841.1 hypothetical protein FHX78_113832 [Streptomyces capillispiralis]GHH90750.1 hypothetical protein GCM10017779_12070 [Streptomyces capillispiralis]
MNGRDSRGRDEEAALSPAEAAVEARALAARGDVTADDVADVLRAVREARERA